MLSGRQFLRLWYLHSDEFELEKMFPNKESMRWARVILDRCIVEEEKNCLQSATELLGLVDEVLEAVERHAQVVGNGIVRRCEICGRGSYNLIIDKDQSDVGNFGLNPRGSRTFKIFSCSHCGHVQLFDLPQQSRSPRAWS